MRVEFVAGARETRRKPAQPADCTTEVADCTTEVAEPWRRDAHVAKEFVKCQSFFDLRLLSRLERLRLYIRLYRGVKICLHQFFNESLLLLLAGDLPLKRSLKGIYDLQSKDLPMLRRDFHVWLLGQNLRRGAGGARLRGA